MPPFAWALAGIGAIGAIVTIYWFVCWLIEKRHTKTALLPDPKPSGGNQPIILQIPPPSTGHGQIKVKLTIDYIDGLPEAPPEIKDPFEEGLAHKKRYEYEDAIRLFRQALSMGAIGSQKAALLLLVGNCFNEQSKFAEAEGHYKEAAAAATEANDRAGLATSYNNIGDIYDSKGDYDKALDWYHKSLKIAEQIGDQAGIARNYNNMGGIYKSEGDYDKALDWYQKSLKITGQIGDQAGLATNYNNIGGIYASKGDYDKALDWYHKSLKIRGQIGDQAGLAANYNNIGTVYYLKSDYKMALDYAEQALSIFVRIGAEDKAKQVRDNIEALKSREQKK